MGNPIRAGAGEFSAIAKKALGYLHDTVGLGLWMVTRVQGDDWIVLEADDRLYGIETPALFKWTDSFCSQMVQGKGPRVAPNAMVIPAYAGAPIARQMQIHAYIGVPILNDDESLFGTLCAIDPQPQPESISEHMRLVELMAEMLSLVVSGEMKAVRLARVVDRLKIHSETDFLTGVFNRRGWEKLSAIEDSRCRRYGHSCCVAVIDLDGLKCINDSQGHSVGDELIVRTSRALKSALRDVDILARVGGDEFLALRVESDCFDASHFENQIRASLREAGVAASVGVARRSPAQQIDDAVKEADRQMFNEKDRRKESRFGPYADSAVLVRN